MSLIQFNQLSFSYEGSYVPIFQQVNLQIDSNWKLGLIGRNGRGKTTLLKLLLGQYEYSGSISADVSFSYFPYPVSNRSDLTLQVVEGLRPDYVHWELLRECSQLELSEEILYRPFQTLSKGEQTKLLLALLFLGEERFLLIDEPTNHLDLHGRDLVSRYLNRKQGFILVSHDRSFLDGCIDHVLSINKTGLDLQRGNYSSWQANKDNHDQFELSQNDRLKKEISRLSEAAKRSTAWSSQVEKTKYDTKNSGLRPDRGYIGHKSAKMMRRAKSLEKRQQANIQEKAQLLKDLEQAPDLKLTQLQYHSKQLLSLRDVTVFYDDTPACQPISLTLEQGDRISLQGKNGSGKSSLLKLILGEDLNYQGSVQKGSQLTISYVPQDSSFLHGNLTEYAIEEQIDQSLFKTILRKLDFSRELFETELQHYSDGQRKKVLLAKSLCQQAHLLIWDEPLNFVDLPSRMQLERLLLDYQPTILFVEHDKSFCDSIANKRIHLS